MDHIYLRTWGRPVWNTLQRVVEGWEVAYAKGLVHGLGMVMLTMGCRGGKAARLLVAEESPSRDSGSPGGNHCLEVDNWASQPAMH